MRARFMMIDKTANPSTIEGYIKAKATVDRLHDIGTGSPNLLLYSVRRSRTTGGF